MLPYFISLLVLGIPLCWAEWTMGRHAGVRGCNSAPAIFTVIWRHPLAKYFGGLALVIPLVIYMYYVLIEAWCLGYAIRLPARGARAAPRCPRATKSSSAGRSACEQDGSQLRGGNLLSLVIMLSVFVFNFALIYRGISKGIERLCMIGMPLMLLLAVRCLAAGVHPGNAGSGPTRAVRAERAGLHVEPAPGAAGRSGDVAAGVRARSSSACRSVSGSSSTTPATCGRKTIWP